jgi:tripartite-type tricarboxylate transporter receptor subunit TctC
MTWLRTILIGLLAGLAPAWTASAQPKYPTKPIELIVPFVAGASTDTGARVVAQALETRWGVPVKVVNKPGGNTVPAVTEMMTAKPDGTTFLVDAPPQSAMLDTVVKNLPFKVTDRTFIGVMAYTPLKFIVHVDSPFKSLGDAAAALKANPETFTWTSLGGAGFQDMAFRMFCIAAGVDVKKTRAVALKGGAEAVTLTAGGHVTLGLGTYSSIAAPLSAGKLRVLAVASPERWPNLPESMTTGEAGFPSVQVLFWIGISGPPGLPPAIARQWETALKETTADPAVAEKLGNVGLKVLYEDARTMAARVERERKLTQEVFAN